MNKYSRILCWAVLIISFSGPSFAAFWDYSQFVIPQASTKISSDAGVYNTNLPIQPFRLFTNQQSASHVSGPAGNAGDNNDFTFKFDRDSRDIALKKLDGGAIGIGEVGKLYNSPDGNGMKVMVKTGEGATEDVFAKYNLIPQGWDLSSNDWANLKIPAGVLPIDPTNGRFILQLPEFVNLESVGNYKVPSKGNSFDIVGNYAYVTDQAEGLMILDIAKPEQPTLVGFYKMPGVNTNGVEVINNYAYVVGTNGLQIIDISDSKQPKLVSSIKTPGPGVKVKVIGDYAYVADLDAGLQIIKISDPRHPQIVGSYDTSGTAKDLRVVGDYAYVADNESGLQIIKISDPQHPNLVSSFKTPTPAKQVEVVGRYAYVGASESGLQIIDISTPEQPKLVGSFQTSKAYGVQIIGSYAFVADFDMGLKIIDISNPKQPKLVSALNTGGSTLNIRVVGNYVYIMNYDQSGLQIFNSIFKFKPINASVQVDYNY